MKTCKTCPTDISEPRPLTQYCDICHVQRKAERRTAWRAESIRLSVALAQFRRAQKAARQ